MPVWGDSRHDTPSLAPTARFCTQNLFHRPAYLAAAPCRTDGPPRRIGNPSESGGGAGSVKRGGADAFPGEVLDVITSLLTAAPGAVGLVAVPGAVLLAGLILRNPFAPRWLSNDAMGQAAGLLLSAAVLAAVSHAIDSFVAAGLSKAAIAVLLVAIPTASVYAFWKAFDIGKRLARAESGQSPFGHDSRTAALPSGLTLQPGAAH